MKICCNVKENDVRYCQDCLEKALIGRTKQIFKELDKYKKKGTLYTNYEKVKMKFLQERMKGK